MCCLKCSLVLFRSFFFFFHDRKCFKVSDCLGDLENEISKHFPVTRQRVPRMGKDIFLFFSGLFHFIFLFIFAYLSDVGILDFSFSHILSTVRQKIKENWAGKLARSEKWWMDRIIHEVHIFPIFRVTLFMIASIHVLHFSRGKLNKWRAFAGTHTHTDERWIGMKSWCSVILLIESVSIPDASPGWRDKKWSSPVTNTQREAQTHGYESSAHAHFFCEREC